MEKMLAGIQGVKIYQDNILIHSPALKDHDEIMLLVLERLRKAGMKLNKEKCELWKTSIEFLGHMIDGNGVTIHPEKIIVIDNLAAPQNPAEVRHIMGMVNYLCRFLPNLVEVVKPINDLLKKDSRWYWGPSQANVY